MTLCGQDEMQKLLDRIGAGAADAAVEAEALASHFPDDPRLQFILGSTLIEAGRTIEAHAALSRAIALAPDYAIARFQLGLFELTSGEVDQALATWARLDALPGGDPLVHFVAGLRHLVRDEFVATVERLRAGIEANTENPPLNRDMQLIIERCQDLIGSVAAKEDTPEASATSLLLGQLSGRTMH